MTVTELLNNKIIKRHPNADVWVETGDFGPTVYYEPAGIAVTVEDDTSHSYWVEEEQVLVSPDYDIPTKRLKVSELVDKLSTLNGNIHVVVSDGFQSFPVLISSCRQLAKYWTRRDCMEKGHSVKEVTKEFGKVTYPIVILDAGVC